MISFYSDKKSTCLVLLFVALSVLISVTFEEECTIAPSLLQDMRDANIIKEAARFYVSNYSYFVDLTTSIVDESQYAHFVMASGLFGNQDSIAYDGNLVPRGSPPQVRLFPTPDMSQRTIVAPGVYRVPQSILTAYGPLSENAGTFDYEILFDGSHNEQYFFFDNCSDQITFIISTLDRDQNAFLVDQTSINFGANITCDLAFYLACGFTPYLNRTGFSSREECFEQYSTLGQSFCPEQFTSNSLVCRTLHAANAIHEPQIHCAHLPYNDSPVCVDKCLTRGCGNCDANAICRSELNVTATLIRDLDTIVSYHCECKQGYKGDGETCNFVESCSVTSDCVDDYPYVACVNGKCKCTNNLIWKGDTGTCGCGSDETIQWDNGLPYCLRKGKCVHRWQCPQANLPGVSDAYNRITCGQFQYPNNITIGDFCLCDHTYDNVGIEYPCACSTPKTEKWDPNMVTELATLGGYRCLAPEECTIFWHCDSQNCVIESGEEIGTCEPTTKKRSEQTRIVEKYHSPVWPLNTSDVFFTVEERVSLSLMEQKILEAKFLYESF